MLIAPHLFFILFVPFFLLFYSEPVKLGAFPVSQLWKIPLAIYMLYAVFQYRRKAAPVWSQTQYWISLKCLFNAGYFSDFANNLQYGIKFLFLPLIYNFIASKLHGIRLLETILLTICQYFVLTNIPMFLGVKPISSGHDYGSFVAYSGVFQNQHAMSVIMGICIVVILYFFKRGRFDSYFSKGFNLVLLGIAAYSMYLGFARTGWLMCVLAIIILFWPRNLSVKQFVGIAAVSSLLVGGFAYMMATNELFYDRVVGNNITTHEKMNIDSGRSEYSAAALDRYLNGSVFEQLCGMSTADEMEAIYQATGLRVGAHNGFVDMLARNGIVGLMLMFFFLMSLFVFIRRRRQSQVYNLAMALWMMNLSFQVTQGGTMFHSDLLYALTFCLLDTDHQIETDDGIYKRGVTDN